MWIEPVGARLLVSCTCPFFFDRLEICKHIWAAIMAAEAQSLPLVAPGVSPRSVSLEPIDVDEDLEDPDLEEEMPVDDWYLRRPVPKQRPKDVSAAPPRWRQLLAAIGGAPSPTPARPRIVADQLLYIIDVAASLAGGVLVIELMTRDRKANGEWGKPKPARLTPSDIQSLPSRTERHMLERLVGARPHFNYGAWTDYGYELSRFRLHGVLAADVVPLLCVTERCLARVIAGTGPRSQPLLLPLAWDDSAPWRFAVSIRRDDVEQVYVIDGSLERNAERMTVTEPLMVLSDGLLITRTHAARLIDGDAYPWLSALRRADALRIPLDARDDLIDTLLVRQPPLAAAPDELRIETVNGIPRARLHLRPFSFRGDRLAADVTFDYEGTSIPAASTQPIVRVPDAPRALRRDAEAEGRFLATLHELGFRDEWSPDRGQRVLQLSVHVLPRIVRPLLDEGWQVEVAGHGYRQPGRQSSTSSLGHRLVRAARRGGVSTTSMPSLPALLAALERGESFVTLGDGTIGLLPEEWLQQARADRAARRRANGDDLRFKRSQVALLDALLAAQPEASWDETFAQRPRRAAGLRRHPAGGSARVVHRHAARLPARRARLAAVPAALRLRRLPRRRHGARQDGHGAGAAGARGASQADGQRASLARRRAAIAGLQLAAGGGAVHPGAARARVRRRRTGAAMRAGSATTTWC